MASDDGMMVQIFDKPKANPRIKCLMDAVEDIEGSVIIWCRFVEEIRQLHEVMGEESICYYGDVTSDARREALTLFREHKKKYLIANVATGGIGLNLTAAATAVYYSNTFSYEDRKQSEDRCHRIGQESDKVLYIDLQAENTVDEKIIKALLLKEDLATFMNDLGNWSV
jgi:SNF2 family DNA or RNA helicase